MKRVSSYLKMRVLGAIEAAPGKTIVARIRHVSEQPFVDEDGQRFRFTWRTIQTWYSRYQKGGTTTVLAKERSDKGKTRKMTPEEVLEAIEQVRGGFRGAHNVTAFYRACIEKGLLQRERIAPNTFRRVVKANELLRPDAEVESKRRLAFAKAHANELWQADTMVGPYVQQGAGKVQAKLIAFLDDASRVCCHGEFFVADNTEMLLKSFRTALYKRGLCECLYVDHGSNYSSLELSQVCQRLGTILCHAPVRDGAAKGKVERFFRTVRESFLTRQLDLSSLDSLNRAFFGWLEDEYHQREHSSLGMKPIDRFGLDLHRIRYLSPGEVSDELFFVEQERSVLADNTFSLKNTRFEAPRDLRNRKVQVRFDRLHFERAIVYLQGRTDGRSQAGGLRRQRPQALEEERGGVMIRAHFGLEKDPFSSTNLTLLPQQREVLDTLRVHCQQGGLCVVVGEPGTGKSVIKQALCQYDPKRLIAPVVNRTLHTYHSTLRILCEAFQIEAEGVDVRCERRLIEEARRLNAASKMLAPVIDDAHPMDVAALRKLRLLFEDFPKNHCLVLIA